MNSTSPFTVTTINVVKMIVYIEINGLTSFYIDNISGMVTYRASSPSNNNLNAQTNGVGIGVGVGVGVGVPLILLIVGILIFVIGKKKI